MIISYDVELIKYYIYISNKIKVFWNIHTFLPSNINIIYPDSRALDKVLSLTFPLRLPKLSYLLCALFPPLMPIFL